MSDRLEHPGLVWPRRIAVCSGLLLGLVIVVLAAAGASHVDGGPVASSVAVVAPPHSHGPSCHEAGDHDAASTVTRPDRWGDLGDGLPTILFTFEAAAVRQVPTVVPVDTRPARPRSGRSHLALAQICRT